MGLPPLLDALYVLGHLWGGLPASQVCIPGSSGVPRASLAAVGAPGLGAPPTAVTAFVDVNVIPMDQERVLLNQTVLVEGGRITALGPATQVKVPAGAVRVDGRGKYLMPGLANMHYHVGSVTDTTANIQKNLQPGLSKDLANGITTIRHLATMTSRSATIREPAGDNVTPEQMRRLVETAEVPIPRIHISAFIPRSLTPDSAAAYVAAARAAGYSHITIPFAYTTLGDEEHKRHQRTIVDSLVAAASRVGLPVASHSHRLPLETVHALGATGGSTEHVYMYWASLGYTLGTPDPNAYVSPSKLQALVTATKRTGVWVTPTLRCSEGIYATPAHIQVLRQTVKALQDAGVGLLLSEDDGYSMHEELTALVGAGLTPYQALVTGTRNPAQHLSLLDSSGTVAVGKWADLVLLAGNPLQDIRHVREPVGTMIAGRWLDRATLDRWRTP